MLRRFVPMQGDVPQTATDMRALVARMRGYAAKTSQEYFRRKFERAASELEEVAVGLESQGKEVRRL